MTGTIYTTLFGDPWLGKMPPADHECVATIRCLAGVAVETCPCGARRRVVSPVVFGDWYDRNRRRQEQTRYYTEDDYPWLGEINKELKSVGGIGRQRNMLLDLGNLAELIVMNIDSDLAREHFEGQPVAAELNARITREALVTMDVALEVGCAHMLVRRGWADEFTTNAYRVDGVALIVVDLPVVFTDGRCLPEAS